MVFNVNNVTLKDENVPIPMDALAEGERDNVIQSPKLSPSSEKPKNQTEPENKPEVGEEPEKVPFPSENPPSEDSAQDAPSIPVQCHAERLRDKPAQHPGFYEDQMARVAHLEAHATCQFVEEEVHGCALISNESDDLDDVNLLPEFDAFTVFDTLSSSIGSEPKTLDDRVLHRLGFRTPYLYLSIPYPAWVQVKTALSNSQCHVKPTVLAVPVGIPPSFSSSLPSLQLEHLQRKSDHCSPMNQGKEKHK